jgi:hypothetical protein
MSISQANCNADVLSGLLAVDDWMWLAGESWKIGGESGSEALSAKRQCSVLGVEE